MEEQSGNLESSGWWARWVRLGRRYESAKMMGGGGRGRGTRVESMAPRLSEDCEGDPDTGPHYTATCDQMKRTTDRKIHPQADDLGVQV